jgi:hypothetical protein
VGADQRWRPSQLRWRGGSARRLRLRRPRYQLLASHEFSNAYGTISIQQRGPGWGLQWGAYPTAQLAGTYKAEVFIDGHRYDAKTQSYPPHGSINAGAVSTGDIVRLEGSFVGSGKNQSFWLECRSA